MTKVSSSDDLNISTGSTAAAVHRPPSTGREDRIKRLELLWTFPKRLSTSQRKKIREYCSLKQGYDGNEAVCFFCKRLLPVDTYDIHHLDHEPSNNIFSNLVLACGPENDKENAQWNASRLAVHRLTDPRQGERELGGGGVAVAGNGTGSLEDELNSIPFSSREGMKAAIMRPRFDRWLRDTVNGPFSNQSSWNPRKLAEAAPYACGENGKAFGSSKTYFKYVREDMAGGILLVHDNIESSVFGINVRLNSERLKKIQEQTGA